MFEKIYWDTLPESYHLIEEKQRCVLHALWPSTIDFDACFETAGFTKFADSDDQWDTNWKSLIEQVVSTLSCHGDCTIRNSVSVKVRRSIWDRLFAFGNKDETTELPLIEQMVLNTSDDRFEHVVVSFCNEQDLTLICGDGHPILWLLMEKGSDWSFTDFLKTISIDCQPQRLVLDWQQLIPSPVASQ